MLGGWADAPVYDSKVQPIYGDAHGEGPRYWTAQTKNIKAMVQAGTCPLRVTIDFAHENGMEPADYASLMRHLADAGRARMNR